jgi:hypothetical protein
MSLDDGLEHREDIQSDVYRAPEIVLDFKPPNSDFLFTDIEWALRKTWAVNIPEWTESCLPPDPDCKRNARSLRWPVCFCLLPRRG